MPVREEVKEKEVEKEDLVREHLLEKGEISLILKDYDDIFSSFDPRHYSEKALSDDFLQEAKRATRDKQGVYELRFLIPKSKRNFEHEILIKRRLKDHFRKHYNLLVYEIRHTEWKGIGMAFAGVVMIFASTVIASALNQTFWMRFFETLLEPAGWFTAWTGLDQFFYTIEGKRPDKEFYRKISETRIIFTSY